MHQVIHDAISSLMRRHHGGWELPMAAPDRAALNRDQAEHILNRLGMAVPDDLAPDRYLPERARLWEAAFDRNMEREFDHDRYIDPLPEHWSREQAPAFEVLFGAAAGWKRVRGVARVGLALTVVALGVTLILDVATPALVVAMLLLVAGLLVLLGIAVWRVHVGQERALLAWATAGGGRAVRGIPGWTSNSGWAREGMVLVFAVSLLLVVGALAAMVYRVVTWLVAGGAGFPLWTVLGFLAAWGLYWLVGGLVRRVHVGSRLRDDAFRWLGWVDEEDDAPDAP